MKYQLMIMHSWIIIFVVLLWHNWMLRKKYKEMKKVATIDTLTGLYNKNYFFEFMKDLPENYIIAYGGLNSFKLINESFGRTIGDMIIEKVAEQLKMMLPSNAILGRYDGDDFIAILPISNRSEFSLERIGDFVKEEIELIRVNEASPSICIVAEKYNSTSNSLVHNIEQIQKNYDEKKLKEIKNSKVKIVESLRRALEQSDYETKQHTDRTSILSVKLGKKLGLSDSKLKQLSLLAALHDLGKIVIPESILLKPDKLTAEEYEIIKTHTYKGYAIASATPDLAAIANGILQHHEKWDGSGYPNGLKGEAICIEARIVGLADAFDVMINERPYKSAMSINEAVDEVNRCCGNHFDPHLVELLEKIIKESDNKVLVEVGK